VIPGGDVAVEQGEVDLLDLVLSRLILLHPLENLDATGAVCSDLTSSEAAASITLWRSASLSSDVQTWEKTVPAYGIVGRRVLLTIVNPVEQRSCAREISAIDPIEYFEADRRGLCNRRKYSQPPFLAHVEHLLPRLARGRDVDLIAGRIVAGRLDLRALQSNVQQSLRRNTCRNGRACGRARSLQQGLTFPWQWEMDWP